MLTAIVARIDRRLRAVRLSASAASTAAGLSADAIRNMRRAAEEDTGRQGVSTASLAALAGVLQTSAGWLIDGSGSEDGARRMGAIVGYVGAGSEAHFYDTGQGPIDEVEMPEGAEEGTVAAEIKGDSLGRLFNGWLLWYRDVRSPVTPDLYGELCIVALPDGRVLAKKIKPSKSADHYHLLSETEDPILDQEVTWAARVTHMTPRRR